jgi:hypothetical protein
MNDFVLDCDIRDLDRLVNNENEVEDLERQVFVGARKVYLSMLQFLRTAERHTEWYRDSEQPQQAYDLLVQANHILEHSAYRYNARRYVRDIREKAAEYIVMEQSQSQAA